MTSSQRLFRVREIADYPPKHHFTTQPNTWMDGRVWRKYLREVLPHHIEGPSVLLLDNLDCHVATESYDAVAEELNSTIRPLPPNSTSVCQPLNVGVMRPLKKPLEVERMEETRSDHMSAREKRALMIHRIARAWDAITPEVSCSSFSKAVCFGLNRNSDCHSNEFSKNTNEGVAISR